MRIFVSIVSLFLFLASCQSKEEREYRKSVTTERSVKNNEFVNEGSPLEEADLATFSGLKYYPIDLNFKITGFLEVLPKQESVLLTQGDTVKRMIRFGKAVFNWQSQEYKLTIYKYAPTAFSAQPEELFVPFFDQTNGTETYEGGRYIYPKILADGSLEIDFNKASNPYCAYNHKYKCVFPPAENTLQIEIKAGEKSYH